MKNLLQTSSFSEAHCAAFFAWRVRRFAPAEDVSSSTAIKSSAIRGIKRAICDQYPAIEEHIDDVFPKKDSVMEAKGCVASSVAESGGLHHRNCGRF
jgi:hypothetical protein